MKTCIDIESTPLPPAPDAVNQIMGPDVATAIDRCHRSRGLHQVFGHRYEDHLCAEKRRMRALLNLALREARETTPDEEWW